MGAVQGLEQLKRRLKLPAGEAFARRYLRQGVARGCRAVVRRARSLVQIESGLLKTSLGVKVKTYPSGVVVGVVGPRQGLRQEVFRPSSAFGRGRMVLSDPAKYAHLIEKGTGPSPARNMATSRPFPFLGPSLRDAQGQVQAAIAGAVERGLRTLGGAA